MARRLSTAASYINNYINYAPTPMRPEWKRYKQYSKSDLQQALDAVRGGLTALQVSASASGWRGVGACVRGR